ncbi:MAG: WXG100 family type VII secretion target [Aquihabitans sp.]
MALTHGMNVEEVKSLGNFLKSKKGQIEGIINEINGKVNGAGWEGPDAQKFKGEWWPEHRNHLKQIGEALDGFGQSALNNASDQEAASGR